VRVLAVDRDVIVFISRAWQTTATALRADDEGFLIDSPVFPDEIEALPTVLEQAGFPVSALLCTHADWDHLLGRLAFPNASLGCGEPTAQRLRAEPGAAQRELRRFDEEHYLERAVALGLGAVQVLPVPGRLALGSHDQELELSLAEGHTGDGTAFWIPWLEILVCGDYLSPVEIPVIAQDGSVEAYLRTLQTLSPLVDRAATVVPGHGAPLDREHALRVLEEDRAYVEALAAGGEQPRLPDGRRTATQRRIHGENLARATARS
jgi:glyoxylase-like metal-dependent hydrolase (beta-lactamase superfamily II)